MTMSSATYEPPTAPPPDPPPPAAGPDVVRLPRRRIDQLLIGVGVIAAIVFAAAGGLLTWGASFANDYVHDELASQNVFFPDEASLQEEGRDDLVKYADEQVTTGAEAEAYASYIDGHLAEIAGGLTYAEIDELQATADELRGQRDSLFRGETLRGLLLSSYAWATIGTIAAIAAVVAFAGAAVMAILVIAGMVHLRRHPA